MKHRLFFYISLFFILTIGTAPLHVYAQTASGCYSNDEAHVLLGPPAPGGGCSNYQNAVLMGPNGRPGANVQNNLTYTPLEPISSTSKTPSDFCGLINLVFKALIYIGGMVAVLYLVLGGITYMVSEAVGKRSKARERIRAAVWGLAILLMSWIILNTINPSLVQACTVLNTSTTGTISSSQGTAADASEQAISECVKNGQLQIVTYNPNSLQISCGVGMPTCGTAAANGRTCCSVIRQPSPTVTGVTCTKFWSQPINP
jgi:hypothetical protein